MLMMPAPENSSQTYVSAYSGSSRLPKSATLETSFSFTEMTATAMLMIIGIETKRIPSRPSSRHRRCIRCRRYAGWPVHELWSGSDPKAMRPRPTWIRIWRDRDYQVFHALIDGSEAEALKQMIRGEPFAAICDA